MLLANACEAQSQILKPPDVLLLESPTFSLFHVASLVIFILAIIHTLSAHKIMAFARYLERRHYEKLDKNSPGADKEKEVCFIAEIVYFLGEIEIIFGIWVIPLFFLITFYYDWKVALEYLNTRDYTEALFVVVIMVLTASRPLVQLSEKLIASLAKVFGKSIGAWWFSILTLGPLLGSVVTEAGAMVLAATLLARKFYEFRPSKKLSYATIALLFVNISVGGLLTNFAAPPVLIVARCWRWSTSYMFVNFGWKAILGVLICNILYWLIFRKELRFLQRHKNKMQKHHEPPPNPIPWWVTVVHILFVVWIVANSHYPAVFIASLLLFLGFHRATKPHQFEPYMRRPLLVGLFIAGLVVHGGLQGWWIIPLMEGFSQTAVMVAGVVLTAFNDNAAVAYLTSLIPDWGESFKYAVISGVVTGGGLTVIANAPNPAGYVILNEHFEGGISPLFLFLWAFIPTVIYFLIFYLTGVTFQSIP